MPNRQTTDRRTHILEIPATRSRESRALLVAVVALMALSGCGGCLQPRTGPPLVLLRTGQTFPGSLQAKVDEQQKLIVESPENPLPHGTMGMIYEANEFWDLASRSYGNATQLAPEYPDWRFHRALCLLELGQREEAVAILDQLAIDHDQHPATYFQRGLLLRQDGELEEALGCFERALAVIPHKIAVRGAIVETHLLLENYDEARAALAEPELAESDWTHLDTLRNALESKRALTPEQLFSTPIADTVSHGLDKYRVEGWSP